jgi:hypothetical protein
MNRILLIGVAVMALGIARPTELRGKPRPRGQTTEVPCLRWNLSALRSDVRKRIHLRAGDVPPFPNEDLRLRDAKNWPTTARWGGEVCSLRIVELDNDVVRPVRSLSEIHSRNGYCLSYQAVHPKERSPKIGPFYCWWPTPNGVWLTEQSNRLQDKRGTVTETYQRYPGGDLMLYEHTYTRNHRFFQHEPGEHLEEIFDQGGCLSWLVGFDEQ